jgi:hypothetical protein
MRATQQNPKRKRFTLHKIKSIESREYEISAAVLASAETLSEAKAIAEKLGRRSYYGLAIWDRQTGIIDCGGPEAPEAKYSPVQPVFAVRINHKKTVRDSTSGAENRRWEA